MEKILDIIYIQKNLYLYKDKYYIKDSFLSNILNINVKKMVKKNKKILNYIKIKNNYLIDSYSLIILSIIINDYYINLNIYEIVYEIDLLSLINKKGLNKIRNHLFVNLNKL